MAQMSYEKFRRLQLQQLKQAIDKQAEAGNPLGQIALEAAEKIEAKIGRNEFNHSGHADDEAPMGYEFMLLFFNLICDTPQQYFQQGMFAVAFGVGAMTSICRVMPEDSNSKKILDVMDQITELMTGLSETTDASVLLEQIYKQGSEQD